MHYVYPQNCGCPKSPQHTKPVCPDGQSEVLQGREGHAPVLFFSLFVRLCFVVVAVVVFWGEGGMCFVLFDRPGQGKLIWETRMPRIAGCPLSSLSSLSSFSSLFISFHSFVRRFAIERRGEEKRAPPHTHTHTPLLLFFLPLLLHAGSGATVA